MASYSNQTVTEDATAELFSINELREKHKTSWAVFAGTCAQAGWKPGRMVTENEYVSAVEKFKGTPMQKGDK